MKNKLINYYNIIKNKDYLFLFLNGFLAFLAFAPFYFFPIFFFTFYNLLNKLDKVKTKKQAFLYGYSYGISYFLSTMYWAIASMTTDPIFYIWIPFALFLIPCLIGLYIAFTTFFYYIINRNNENKLLKIISFASLFVIFEYLRVVLFSGLPWNLLIYSLTKYIYFIQTISLINIFTFDFFYILILNYFYIYKNK